ncbi:MAG: type II secretion system protein [Pseudomonadota bacterium]
MNNRARCSPGFTLFELVAVTAVIGLMLVFTLPRFQAMGFFSQTSDPVSMVIIRINDLKKRAVSDAVDYVLHIQANPGKLWTTTSSMAGEEAQAANDNAFKIPDSVTIVDVVFPEDRVSRSYPYSLHFSRYGYSDQACIHLREVGADITLRIEPFLPGVERVNGYVAYEACN